MIAVAREVVGVVEVAFQTLHVVCHIPSSYVFDVVVEWVVYVVMVEDGGSSPDGATQPASAGAVVIMAGSAPGMVAGEITGVVPGFESEVEMEVEVEVKVEVSVEVEDMQFTLDEAVNVSVM